MGSEWQIRNKTKYTEDIMALSRGKATGKWFFLTPEGINRKKTDKFETFHNRMKRKRCRTKM
jgi:hypothetical protein